MAKVFAAFGIGLGSEGQWRNAHSLIVRSVPRSSGPLSISNDQDLPALELDRDSQRSAGRFCGPVARLSRWKSFPDFRHQGYEVSDGCEVYQPPTGSSIGVRS